MAEGDAIDWDAEEAQASGPEELRAIRGLRLLAEVGAVGATLTAPGPSTPPSSIGPYRLVSSEPGVKTVHEKNPDWWGLKEGRSRDGLEWPPRPRCHPTQGRRIHQSRTLLSGTWTSCTLTLKEEAPDLLDMNDEPAMLVASNTFDINEFILSLIDLGLFEPEFKPIPLELPYHVPCQYKAHRIGRPGLELLSHIPSLTIVESDALCCGIAGTYGYKREKYEISMQVGVSLFEFIKLSKAPIVVCDSETCRWQITHATGILAVHGLWSMTMSSGHADSCV